MTPKQFYQSKRICPVCSSPLIKEASVTCVLETRLDNIVEDPFIQILFTTMNGTVFTKSILTKSNWSKPPEEGWRKEFILAFPESFSITTHFNPKINKHKINKILPNHIRFNISDIGFKLSCYSNHEYHYESFYAFSDETDPLDIFLHQESLSQEPYYIYNTFSVDGSEEGTFISSVDNHRFINFPFLPMSSWEGLTNDTDIADKVRRYMLIQ
jgi:hypothetical protein